MSESQITDNQYRQNLTSLLWRFVAAWSHDYPLRMKKDDARFKEHQQVVDDVVRIAGSAPRPTGLLPLELRDAVVKLLRTCESDYVRNLEPAEVEPLLREAEKPVIFSVDLRRKSRKN